LDPGALAARCRATLGRVSTPKRVVIVDELPTTAVGKVDKRAVREMITHAGE
jgi:acyl-CoA synthetase (AMP-forming)/AMP-acid ligase II